MFIAPLRASCLLALLAVPLAAQDNAIPAQDWRSISTQHFSIHYPRQMDEWSRYTAARLESIHEAVTRLVGHTPKQRIQVLIDDPSNISNGYAMAGPLIYLFPTPPEPRSAIGENRGWSEMLAVHEFAHIAHFDRPSRNATTRFLSSLLPIDLGPILLAPRWVLEGYATYVEGKLTGSGRPHGLWRPTILRQLALQGQLPRYSQLDATQGFYAGSMAYLAGSAFLEWLVAKEGDSSLVNVWRRMTARTSRSFSSAFSGVFGDDPATMYGRFTAEVTANALAVEKAIDAAGKVDGELFQRFPWYTGDPALSPDGKQLAVVLRSRYLPPRLVILSTAEDTITDAARKAAERARERDPEDVPAVSRTPRPHKQLASIASPAGRAIDNPRFFRDGSRLLFTRVEGLSDGRRRQDLFEWNWKDGSVRRITQGAGIADTDPAPSGDWAAGIQCVTGFCSVVSVSLSSGAVRILAKGSAERAFYHPRVSPDGSRILASMQQDGRWRLVTINSMSGDVTLIDPDDGASRFDAEFIPDGGGVVTVSTAGGVFNLELLDTSARTSTSITNIAGGAFAPVTTPRGDSVYFLSLTATGYDIRRASLAARATTPAQTLRGGGGSLEFASVAAPPSAPPPTPAAAPLAADNPYGFGPQRLFWIPDFGADAVGEYGGVILGLSDPVGRLGTTAVFTAGTADSWRGASLQTTWRGWPLHASGAIQAAGRRFRIAPGGQAARTELRYLGAAFALQKEFDYIQRDISLSVGAWGGTVDDGSHNASQRTLAFASASLSAIRQSRRLVFRHQLIGNFEGGRTSGEAWNRTTATLSTSLSTPAHGMSASIRYGIANADRAPGEQFLIGGDMSPHLDARSSGNLVASPVLRNSLTSVPDFLQARGELSGVLPVTVYGEWTWPGGDSNDYFATAGLFLRTETPRVPQIGAPQLSGQFGVGTVLAGPHARRAVLYMMMRLTP